MNTIKIVLSVLIVLATMVQIASIGKPRPPLKGWAVAFDTIINAGLVYFLIS